MIRKIRKFKRSLLNKNEDFQTRLIRIVLLLAFAASIIGMGRVVLGAALEVLYALIPLCIVSGIALYMADDRRKIKKAVRLLVFTSNLILFPLIFIMSGGVDSGTPVWFVLGLSYVFLLFDGRELVITFLMSAVAFLVSYGFAYVSSYSSYREPYIQLCRFLYYDGGSELLHWSADEDSGAYI